MIRRLAPESFSYSPKWMMSDPDTVKLRPIVAAGVKAFRNMTDVCIFPIYGRCVVLYVWRRAGDLSSSVERTRGKWGTAPQLEKGLNMCALKSSRGSKLVVGVLAVLAGIASSAVWAREIVVAQVAPFSGAQAASGKALRAGIQLCFDAVNAAGGINGAKIRFVTKDDGYKPNETVRLIKETLAADKPVAFIASIGTANLEALKKDGVLVNGNIPMVGGASGASSMIGAPNIFITKATHHDEVDKLFSIVTTVGLNQAAIVYQNDTFGKDVLAGAEAAAPKTGVKILVKAPYERNTTNVGPAVDAVLKSEAPLIYLVAVTSAAIEFIKQYRQQGGKGQIYGLSVIDSGAVAAKLGAEMARGYAFGTVIPPTSAKTFAIVREYQELVAKSKIPDLAERSMEGYVAAKVLVHALRTAGKPSAAAVLKAMSNIKQLDIGDYIVDFTRKDRTGSQFVDFAILSRDARVMR
jgi:ABC-type branched-subunit amino acid transport system substrate-binding protein